MIVGNHTHNEGKVIPHIFFSKEMIERVKKDIETGKLQKVRNTDQLGLSTIEFSAISYFDEVPEMYRSDLYQEENNESKEIINISKDLELVLKSTSLINGILTHQISISNLENIATFNNDLLEIPSIDAQVLEIPDHNDENHH